MIFDIGFNKVIEQTPIAYQIIDNKTCYVSCEFILKDNTVSFNFPEGYDNSKTLIIDPTLIASTLSGSTYENWGHTATYDLNENIYSGARCFGSGYPTTFGAYQQNFNGSIDIAISKLNPDGSNLIWATYLGGSSNDYPHSMITDNQGDLYIYGTSSSSNYPTSLSSFSSTNSGNTDIIVSHLSDDGTSLIGSSYIGGNSVDGQNSINTNYGDTYRGEIYLDTENSIYISSFSSSNNFPTSVNAFQNSNMGGQDAVVFKFNNDVSVLEWSTYIGSTSNDAAYGIRVNDDFETFVTGVAGIGFPMQVAGNYTTFNGGQYDGFIVKLNQDGTDVLANSFFGTSGNDESFFIDIDNEERVYIFGQNSSYLPITANCYGTNNSSQFIAKFDEDLNNILWQTTIGSRNQFSYDFVPIAFMVDICKGIYISGHGGLSNIPNMYTTNDSFYGSGGFYLMVLEPDASAVKFASYYTGNHVDGGTSRFDPKGKVYQAVCSCNFGGGLMSTNTNAYSTSQSTSCDIGVFKIDFDFEGVNAIASFTFDNSDICDQANVQFENLSSGSEYFWEFGDGTNSTETNPNHLYENAGIYYVSLIAIDSTTCNFSDTSMFEIEIFESSLSIDSELHCDNYTWIDGNTYTTSNNTATHTLTNSVGCDSIVTLNLTILNSSTGTDNQTHCDNFTWIDGNTYTTSNNTATHTLTNSVGCDSIVTLNLTILNSSTGTDNQTHCDNFTWIDGNTYTTSNNTATHTLTNSVGCDSIVTLNLTILNSSTGTDNQTHCDNFTWIDGNTYTTSNNTATHTLTNSLGCDSIVTLNLTILNSSTGTDNQTHCDNFTWIDGNTYTTSNNTATHTLTNSVGCDSIVTLNLTILNSNSGVDNQTHCDNFIWIDGNTYTTSNNTATHTLTNSVGWIL